ncbi:MAG: putative intron-encoded HNH endonuclease [Siphoviridae sp. ctdc_1]|nr:MAG: putative intron-encoded HNH endonuclease [Siphoviridae sp. ctdc_1]
MLLEKICPVCEKHFAVPHWRSDAKTCSRDCRQQTLKAVKDTKCDTCGKMFHVKRSQKIRYSRTLGYFCSNTCLAKCKETAYSGDKNPNHKAATADADGYLIWQRSSITDERIKEKKLHRAVACETLQVIKIGEDLHVHHRDCDILNNAPVNLSIMTVSDHRWIHKNVGNAVMWAISKGFISTSEVSKWSSDPERCEKLLNQSVVLGFDENTMEVIDGVLKLKQ